MVTSICWCNSVKLRVCMMDGCFTSRDLKALQNLICPPKDDSDTNVEDDLPQVSARKLGPSDIGVSTDSPEDDSGPYAPLQGADNDIWHPAEAADISSAQDHDPRNVPEYEIKFKQAVTAEDIYLGMGFKTPSTASCEWLSVLVKLPEEMREKVELSVESEAIDVRSPRYRLHLPTPHTVDPNASSAKWHNDTSTLEVTLRLKRELDYVNF